MDLKLQVEHARYEAQRAERRYRAVDPENRLVARGLEAEWEKSLCELQSAEADLTVRQAEKARILSADERAQIFALGKDVELVWSAPSTTDRDQKELLRTLVEEVVVDVKREIENAHVILRWRGGLVTELDVHLRNQQPWREPVSRPPDVGRRLASDGCGHP